MFPASSFIIKTRFAFPEETAMLARQNKNCVKVASVVFNSWLHVNEETVVMTSTVCLVSSQMWIHSQHKCYRFTLILMRNVWYGFGPEQIFAGFTEIAVSHVWVWSCAKINIIEQCTCDGFYGFTRHSLSDQVILDQAGWLGWNLHRMLWTFGPGVDHLSHWIGIWHTDKHHHYIKNFVSS